MYGWGRDEDESFGGRTGTAAPMAAATVSMMVAASSSSQQQGQWGQEETKELIRIRADMERDSLSASAAAAGGRRSKALWEAVSAEMLRSGFARTPEQCKCKWKNLLNRYKGKETSDPANGRQCPFFDELHALFNQRAKNMQRLLMESEVGSPRPRKKVKRPNAGQFSDEFSENEEEDKDDSDEKMPARSNRRKRKAEETAPDNSSKGNSGGTDIQELLEEFFQQQMRMEKQWMEMMERRSYEQMMFEHEWRQSMEKLERERLVAEQAWRAKEEQRREREESRAERRDALLTTLLNSLIDDHNV